MRLDRDTRPRAITRQSARTRSRASRVASHARRVAGEGSVMARFPNGPSLPPATATPPGWASIPAPTRFVTCGSIVPGSTSLRPTGPGRSLRALHQARNIHICRPGAMIDSRQQPRLTYGYVSAVVEVFLAPPPAEATARLHVYALAVRPEKSAHAAYRMSAARRGGSAGKAPGVSAETLDAIASHIFHRTSCHAAMRAAWVVVISPVPVPALARSALRMPTPPVATRRWRRW
jgi:hypothetical protein